MSAATGALLPLGGDAVARLSSGPPRAFEDLLTTLAGAALVPTLAWLWITTTWTVVDVLRGADLRPSAGLTRRLVLIACGVAAVTTTPLAHASDGTGTTTATEVTVPAGAGAALAGLPLPERASDEAALRSGDAGRARATPPREPPDAVTPQPSRDTARAPRTGQAPRTGHTTPLDAGHGGRYVVAPGDSLWSIARDHLPAGADDGQVDDFWRAIARANRAAIGSDPHLIHPRTVLDLPTPRSLR